MIADVAPLFLVVLPFINWLAVLVLVQSARRAGGYSLPERRNIALAIAIETTIVAFLALNSRVFHISFNVDVITVVIVVALAVPTLVNAWWLIDAVRS